MDSNELKLQEITTLINRLFHPEGWKDESIFESLCLYFSDEDIDSVSKIFIKKGDTQSYYWLVKYLIQVERPYGFEKLFALFSQENEAILRIVRQGILKVSPNERYNLLIRILKLERKKEICFAAEELGKVGKIEALSDLLSILEQDETEEVRIAILRTLGRLQDVRSLKTLEKYVKDSKGKVQEEAIVALYKFTSVRNVKFLKRCFSSDSSHVREVAYFTAARSRNARVETDLAFGLMREIDPKLQFNILSSLRTIKSRLLFDIVSKLARSSFYPEVRMIAESALRRAKSRKLMQWLIDAQKKEEDEKAIALKLLTEFTNKKGVLKIFEKNAVEAHDKRVRLLAIETLGTIRHARSSKVLLQLIYKNDDFSYAAGLALANQISCDNWPFIERIFSKNENNFKLIQQTYLATFRKLPQSIEFPIVIEKQIESWMAGSDIPLKCLAIRIAYRLKTKSAFGKLLDFAASGRDKRIRKPALQAIKNAIEKKAELFVELLVHARNNHRLLHVANQLAKTIFLGKAQFTSILIKTVEKIVEQQKIKSTSDFDRKQYVIILRSFVNHRIGTMLDILKSFSWNDDQARVIMMLFNSLDVESLELYDLQFLIEEYKNSKSVETKVEFLRFFSSLKKRTPLLEQMIFQTLSEAETGSLKEKAEEVLSAWVGLAEKGANRD